MRGDIFSLIGKALVIIIPALAILGFAVPTALGLYNLSLLSTYLAVPMLLASIVYLLFCRNVDIPAPAPSFVPQQPAEHSRG